jgi:hypothetical protein
MDRSQIPAALRASRPRDCSRFTTGALSKMQPPDVAIRLITRDALLAKARQRLADADGYRLYTGLAAEVFSADPKRAAELCKAAGVSATPEQSAAGVPGWVHRPFWGEHSHPHAAWDGPDADHDGGHRHTHTHNGDSNHHHTHANVSVKSARPVQPGALAKTATPRLPSGTWRIQTADRTATVHVPILDAYQSKRVIGEMIDAGQLGELQAEIGRVAKAVEQTRGTSKAERYERQAAVMASGEDRAAYLELARREREKAGVR